MKTYRQILQEAKKGRIEKEELIPGFTFFIVSKNGASVSRYKIIDEMEINIGTVLNVKHAVIAGEKFKQDKIAKAFITKEGLKVFRTRKEAISAFKKVQIQLLHQD